MHIVTVFYRKPNQGDKVLKQQDTKIPGWFLDSRFGQEAGCQGLKFAAFVHWPGIGGASTTEKAHWLNENNGNDGISNFDIPNSQALSAM